MYIAYSNYTKLLRIYYPHSYINNLFPTILTFKILGYFFFQHASYFLYSSSVWDGWSRCCRGNRVSMNILEYGSHSAF